MANIEHRLRRIEQAPMATEHVVGYSQAEIDRQVAELRARGFSGHIEPVLIQWTIVSPPPRDEAGNIIGPAPEPYIWDPTKLLEVRHDEAV